MFQDIASESSKKLETSEYETFFLRLKNSCFVFRRTFSVFLFPSVLISSCFRFFFFSILLIFASSDVFIVDCICLLHCFCTVCEVLCFCVVTASATDLIERFLLSGIFYLTLLHAFIKASLGPTVLTWRL